MTQHDFEDRLRGMLAAQAADAPRSEDVERRVLTDVLTERPSRHIPWRSFGAPLIAAGAVAAVVAALVGVEHVRTTAIKHTQPAAPSSSSSAPVPVVPVPTTPPPATSTVTNTVGLNGFTILDTTWVGPDTGWALGSAQCVSGSGRCTAIVHTTDGTTWHSVPNPPVNVIDVNGCMVSCANEIRFATAQIGYVFGQSTFFMTTDGGKTWKPQSGGAWALETLDNNVIRLDADHSGCPGPCNLRVELSDLGSTTWTTVPLPNTFFAGTTPGLLRTGSSAYIWQIGTHAGSLEAARLAISTDDGHSWTQHGDPCAMLGRSAAKAVFAAADGSLTVTCWDQTRNRVITSTDSGASFSVGPALSGVPLAAVSERVLIGIGSGGLERSTDAGASWKVVVPDIGNGEIECGFQSVTTGRCNSNGGARIWTTRDAGATWTATTFP